MWCRTILVVMNGPVLYLLKHGNDIIKFDEGSADTVCCRYISYMTQELVDKRCYRPLNFEKFAV